MRILFEIFYRFLYLGIFSFGGPVAHLGYFRITFVEKLQWLDENSYSKIVALSQFLPGPSSSQVGFTIGLKKGGIIGAITAFIAFTLPSFLLLYLAVTLGLSNTENSITASIISGLKLFAVVIVLDAVISMFKSFCKQKITFIIFILATLFLIFFNSIFSQILVLILGGYIGSIFIEKKASNEKSYKKKTNKTPLLLFGFLLLILPIIDISNLHLDIFNSFYQAGSLVFGGGHVVLPLLQNSMSNLVTTDNFITAYSLAQAVPGPMFTIASYLGADILKDSPFIGALIATTAIFLPGFLLILSFYESFETYTSNAKIQNFIMGVNAAVVGLLAAVLTNTIAPSAIHSFFDIMVVLIGLFLLRQFKLPILVLILSFIAIGFII